MAKKRAEAESEGIYLTRSGSSGGTTADQQSELARQPGGRRRAGVARSVSGVAASTEWTWELDSSRSSNAEDQLLELDDVDLIDLEFDDGFRVYLPREDFKQEVRRRQTSARSSDDRLRVPVTWDSLDGGDSERGLASWTLKILRGLKIDVAGETASVIAKRLEPAEEKTGVFQLALSESADAAFNLIPLAPESIEPHRPLLVLIHGTFSSTNGGFGDLATAQGGDAWKTLVRRFGENNIITLEHRTVTESPISNALQLAKVLTQAPFKDMPISLLTHSRGGLVGEFLCRGAVADGVRPFSDSEMNLFRGNEYEDSRRDLTALNELMADTPIKVERFIRVACPARGTTLASERLDRYLAGLTTVIGNLPFLKGNIVYKMVSELLLAVAKERTDPTSLPGLESMMPGSPCIHLLNMPRQDGANPVPVHADLSVVRGDSSGAGILKKLVVFFADLFYREPNDLVVPTRAMLGGSVRSEDNAVLDFSADGRDVNHFRYFDNKRFTDAILERLSDRENSLFKKPGVPAVSRGERLRKPVEPQGSVVLVPGLLGSHLARNGNRIWLDWKDLGPLGRGWKELAIGKQNVTTDGVIDRAYGRFISYLSDTHLVELFPYDWRLSIRDEGHRLERTVSRLLDQSENSGLPVSLVCHSMGGLVARSMFAHSNDLTNRFRSNPNNRLIMLGTPSAGSHSIVRVFLGHERLANILSFFDGRRTSKKELFDLFAAYPGILELLPREGDSVVNSYFDIANWKELKKDEDERRENQNKDEAPWGVPDAPALSAAGKGVEALQQIEKERADANAAGHLSRDWVTYIAGIADDTPIAMIKDEDGVVEFETTSQGDGRVPWSTGIPADVRVHYMDASHGALADHPSAFPALRELITDGETSRLRTDRPVSRSSEVRGRLGPDPEEVFPDENQMIDAALGRSGAERRRQPVREIKISVHAADLVSVSEPIAVGHYQDEMMTGTERALDHKLGGLLSDRYRLDRYPGETGTARAVLRSGERQSENNVADFDGALVLGLGPVGTLLPGGVRQSMAAAVSELLLEVSESENLRQTGDTGQNDKARADVREVSFATLAIGAGHSGVSMEDSVVAILRGIHQTADAMAERTDGQRVVIDRVRFIERYRDRADQIAHVLRRITQQGVFRHRFQVEPVVQFGRGHLPGGGDRFDPEWWQRVQISRETDGGMKFVAITERARAEVIVQREQKRLIEGFLQNITADTNKDDKLSSTLYELLVPNEFKDYSAADRNQLLVLDEDTARYPWELMIDSRAGDRIPPVTRVGLIRQLSLKERTRNDVYIGGRDVLVIGEPKTEGTFSKPMSRLPGAKKEAEELVRTFNREGFAVNSSINEGHEEIIQKFFERDYRVIHLAGHGVFDFVEQSVREEYEHRRAFDPATPAPPPVSGMVLDNGVFLSAVEISNMRCVPEMVFINCCHLGKLTAETDAESHQLAARQRSELAASLAKPLIQRGARAVVVAGWAVDDGPAELFAKTYYEQMFAGTAFGIAVRLARLKAYENKAKSNTWGAYQCYGSPDYRFGVHTSQSSSIQLSNFVSANECARELESLWLDCQAERGDKVSLEKKLERLEGRIPADFRYDPQVLALRGRINGELANFDKAIGLYSEALEINQSTAPLDIIEQRENLRVRRHEEKLKAHDNDTIKLSESEIKSIRQSVREAAVNIEKLIAFAGESTERLNLIGSAGKRLAELQDDEGFVLMASGYRRASELALRQLETGQADQIDYYALNNWLFARSVLKHRRKNSSLERTLRDGIDRELHEDNGLVDQMDEIALRIRREFGSSNNPKSSFWDSVAVPDLEFSLLLHDYAKDISTAKSGRKSKSKRSKKKAGSKKSVAAAAVATAARRLQKQYRSVLNEHNPSERERQSVKKNISFACKCFASDKEFVTELEAIESVFDETEPDESPS